MENLSKWSICFNCLGCNQLELKSFKGVMKCDNFIRGTYDIQNNWKDNWKIKTKNKF